MSRKAMRGAGPAAAREDLVASGMPDWLIRAGEFDSTTDAVAVLTRRPPRSIADFVTEADAFAPIVQPA